MGLNSFLTSISEKFCITRRELNVLFVLFFATLPFFLNKYFIRYEFSDVKRGVSEEVILGVLDSIAEAEAKRLADLDSVAQIAITDTSIIFSVSNRKPKFLGVININTASKSDLMKLENIGEKTAENIIEYRKSKPFKRIEDVLFVKGIGEKTFFKLRPHIKVN